MKLPFTNNSLLLFFKLFSFYLLLLTIHGYSFGDNDHIEIMSYVKWLNNKALYPNDYYIQHIISRIPNERIVMAYLLSKSGAHLEAFTFLLHFTATIALLLGLYKIASIFIKNETYIWIFFVLFFIPFYKFNLGGNDIYYCSINLSKVCGVWLLYYVLKTQFYHASLVGIAATLFHPMAGLQIFILSFGASFLYFLEKLFSKKILSEEIEMIKKYLISILLYILTAGIWILMMLFHFNEGNLSPTLFKEIIDFRLPHHFVPSAFGLKNYLVLLPLFAFGFEFFRKKDSRIFYLFCISILGLIAYTLGISIFNNYAFISTQWFKTTIWLKMLSVLALAILMEKNDLLAFIRINKLTFLKTEYLLTIISLFCILIMSHPISFFKNKDYHFPFVDFKTAEIDIALLAKAHTPITAQFLTPASCTAFKYYSERGSYVDFKAVTHSKDAFDTWYERIQEVYRVGGKDATIKGFAVTNLADEHFANLKENDFMEMKMKGVNYLLCTKKQQLNFTKVVENEQFIVYKL